MKFSAFCLFSLFIIGGSVVAFSDSIIPPESVSYDRNADPHEFRVFMRDGGWCWFQDPRALLDDNIVFVGGVQGNGSGPVKVGVFDLSSERALGTVVLRDNFQGNDHNTPAFYRRPNGRVLAVYARHNVDKFHYFRVSLPNQPLEWGEEQVLDHGYLGPDNVTYMNLFALRKEGLLYNFFRGFDFNPSFVVSSDHGQTWGSPTHLLASELQGRHRPYARYLGNGFDTVHIAFTDGHPRNYGNSIYYAAFRNGRFYHADGRLIKALASDGPLRPSEADVVYLGSGTSNAIDDLSAPGSAWTSSIAFDQDGNPHIGYTLYHHNNDLRYRIASWNGTTWLDREIAFAGTSLYNRESSYTGLVTLDPVDPSFVVISSNVDPTSGETKGGRHEIYQAHVDLADDISSISWLEVTRKSPVSNLRPVILRDDNNRVVLWNRGEFRTYTDYQLDTVGVVHRLVVKSP